jgi:hypothetical protein
MSRRKKEKKTYKYDCSLTGESFVVTEKALYPDELMSVEAFYELNPDKEDRPLDIRKKVEIRKEIMKNKQEALEKLQESSELEN